MKPEPMTTEEKRRSAQSLIYGHLMLGGVIIVIFLIWLCLAINNFHYEDGMTAFDKGQYTRAVSEFQLDVKLSPNHSLGYYYLGKSLEGEGKLSNAAIAYQKASDVEKASNHPDIAFAAKCLAHANSCRGKIPNK